MVIEGRENGKVGCAPRRTRQRAPFSVVLSEFCPSGSGAHIAEYAMEPNNAPITPVAVHCPTSRSLISSLVSVLLSRVWRANALRV